MYEIESVPVPIPDKNTKANNYSQIRIHKPYKGVNVDYYIQLCIAKLVICNLLGILNIVKNCLW